MAREYRQRRDRREAPYRMMFAALIVLALVNFTAYYGVHAGNSGGSGGSPFGLPSSGGPSDNVTLGTPTVRNTTCGDGQNMTTESVPWVSATVVPSTGDVFLEIVELLDGDVDGGPEPAPTVTATSVCASAPLTVAPSWYAVLQAPVGANVAVFSYSTNWIILDHSAATVPIYDGSTLVVVADPQLSGASFELCALGGPGGLSISVCAEL
jgi:hypothetical protein